MRTQTLGLPARRSAGFTLMELVIVMTVIAILATIAIPIYQKHIQRAREVVLMKDLFEIRGALDKYYADKEKAPATLQDIVEAGYMRSIPQDPITKSSDTWIPQMEDAKDTTKPDAKPGIVDVHSGAEGSGSDGRPYSEY